MSTYNDNRFYRELLKYDGRKPEPPYDSAVTNEGIEMKDATPTKTELLQHIQELQDMLAAHKAQDAQDVRRYLTTFAHYHVNKGDGTDTCKQCGLDLRDQIHFPEWISIAMRAEKDANHV